MQNGMLDWQTQGKLYSGIAIAGHVAILILIGIVVSKSTVSGKHLLVIGAIWLLGVCAWGFLAPARHGMWGVKFSGRHRVAIAILYFFLWTDQFLKFGWLIPLGIGIYRLVLR